MEHPTVDLHKINCI